MDVAIFGAGIAGLMTAITLRAHGHQCHIYERSRQAHDAGMGFILVPDAIARLESFGVQIRGESGGTELEGYTCRDALGEIVFEQAMPRGSRGVRRRDLTAALMKALGEDNAVIYAELKELLCNAEDQVTAAHFRSCAGNIRVSADLYVGAEGVNSRARQTIFPDWPTTPDRVPEFVGLVRCDRAAQWAGNRLNKFHAVDGGIALGVLPVDREHVVWYMQFDSHRYPIPSAALRSDDSTRAGARRAFLEKLVGSWAHPVPSLLANTDFARVYVWRPVDTDLVPSFHRQNLVLVGDSAHPLSPFTSEGVASAIADAVALAEELTDVGSPDDLESALARYSHRRHHECAPYLAKGRQLSANFLEPLSKKSALLPIALTSGMETAPARPVTEPVRKADQQFGKNNSFEENSMYDAIVVGARCDGSPTALLLARKGSKVLLVDRSAFPSDMAFSNHFMHQAGAAVLKRMGLLERLAATNCPPITEDHFDYGAFSLFGPVPAVDGVNTAFAPRRIKLDPMLAAAAVESGAELRDGFSVQELLWDKDRVVGVRGKHRGVSITEKAKIVVGADGMFSIVAKGVHAPQYKTQQGLEGSWYAYWSGVPMKGWHLWLRPNRVVFAYNTNDNLTLIGVAFPIREIEEVRSNVEKYHQETIAQYIPELYQRMRSNKRESHFVGGVIPYYMRRPYGPGWALVGDAGYQKDPCTASGITDAFRSAEWLAEAIDAGFSGREPLQRALAGYEDKRNRSETAYFDMTTQLAALAPPPPELAQLLAALQHNHEQRGRFFSMLAHGVPVEEFFSPENAARIMGRQKASA